MEGVVLVILVVGESIQNFFGEHGNESMMVRVACLGPSWKSKLGIVCHKNEENN